MREYADWWASAGRAVSAVFPHCEGCNEGAGNEHRCGDVTCDAHRGYAERAGEGRSLERGPYRSHYQHSGYNQCNPRMGKG